MMKDRVIQYKCELFRSGEDARTRERESEEEKERRMKTVECYYCNRLGHYAWGCPEKRSKRPRGESNSGSQRE